MSIVSTKGAIGPLQDMAVLAADLLISPVSPDVLSARKLARGTIGMLERLSRVEHMGFPLGNLYGLIYRMDRTADARSSAEALRAISYGPSRGRIMILDTVTVAYREAACVRQPVHRWERSRRGPTPSGLESPCRAWSVSFPSASGRLLYLPRYHGEDPPVSRRKTLKLTLPVEFLDFCEEYHADPETVLRGFIADLCGIRNRASDPRPDGLCSHGSDEREMAWAYFERGGYGFVEQ